MVKVFIIAWKEFTATVFTKAFILGLLLPPFFMTVAMVALPLLMNKKPPTVFGHIAVIDQSGKVAPRIVEAFSPEKVRERREQREKETKEQIDKAIKSSGLSEKTTGDIKKQMEANPAANMANMIADTNLTVQVLPPETPVDEARQAILKATGREKAEDGNASRLALIVIPKNSVVSEEEEKGQPVFGSYQLLTAPRLDIEVQSDIRRQASRAIVDTRLADAGQNIDRMRALMAPPVAEEKAVTATGDSKINEAAKLLVPGAFMFLLWISTFSAGQYLLMSTIEEKSSRVMEVILSAVSPLHLMLGKIIGKGAVGLLILSLFSGAGVAALIFFAMADLVAWQNLILLLIYFVLAYVMVACLMASIGAAVNDINEAQSLMTPVMLILVVPMMLWMPILRNPNSMFAQVCSFVPLINPFVMVLRISGSEPVPMWQIPVSILVGLLTVVFMCWASAKIFRIGVLMYGKPPNFATLIKWVRMA
ncbi:MAG: ABC transporter permease [Phycisphaerales bacterium]|nr:ABC transporter permease [Phycisphaerales bacterium]